MPEPADPAPQVMLIGGPNGAGKTTFVREFVAERRWPYLGADEFAYELSPDDPYAVRMEAGRLFVERFYDYVALRESFIVESTLSGRTFRHEIAAAKTAGYVVHIAFYFLDSAERSVERVAARIRAGGHFVPPDDIRRRYVRCLRNFWELYRPLADRFSLVYNAERVRRTVATGTSTEISVRDGALFERFLTAMRSDNDS